MPALLASSSSNKVPRSGDKTPTFQKSGAHGGRSHSAFRILFVSAFFVILLFMASLIGRNFVVVPDAPAPAQRYLGVVQLAPNQRGQCERFEFDNVTGSIKPKGSIGCDDTTAALPSSSGGSLGRLSGIREYFKSH